MLPPPLIFGTKQIVEVVILDGMGREAPPEVTVIEMPAREAHEIMMRSKPDLRLKWAKAVFPEAFKSDKAPEKRELYESLIRSICQEGYQLEVNGERRLFVPVAGQTGGFWKGTSMWMVSLDGVLDFAAATSQIEEALHWPALRDSALALAKGRRPRPLFMLTARVRTLLSDAAPCPQDVQLEAIPDVYDDAGSLRTESAGQADPLLLQADISGEYNGLYRILPSAIVRCGGLIGILTPNERLRGTGIVRWRPSMEKCRLDPAGGFREKLRIVRHSVIRPHKPTMDILLILEAMGSDAGAMLRAHEESVTQMAGEMTEGLAKQLLRPFLAKEPHLECDADSEQMENAEMASYFQVFAELHGAGFPISQQPLRSILQKLQLMQLESARRRVVMPGVWYAMAAPEEAGPTGTYELTGLECYLRVPASDGRWRTLVGRGLVGRHSNRHPAANLQVTFVDNLELERKSIPGLLYFSVQGPCPQSVGGSACASVGSFDYDGDEFFVIEPTSPALPPALDSPLLPPLPADAAPVRIDEAAVDLAMEHAGRATLAETVESLLITYPKLVRAGLSHYQWSLEAGSESGKAIGGVAAQLALYCAQALEAEKGRHLDPEMVKKGQRLLSPAASGTKWDFLAKKFDDPSTLRQSPAIAGQAFRFAHKLYQEVRDAKPSTEGLAPVHLLVKAWELVKVVFGENVGQQLLAIAKDLQAECSRWNALRAENSDHLSRHFSQESKVEGIRRLRALGLEKVTRLGCRTLEELAVAAYIAKYVEGKAAYFVRDNPSWPWTILAPELITIITRNVDSLGPTPAVPTDVFSAAPRDEVPGAEEAEEESRPRAPEQGWSWGRESGAIVLQNPRTGEQFPAFDPSSNWELCEYQVGEKWLYWWSNKDDQRRFILEECLEGQRPS